MPQVAHGLWICRAINGMVGGDARKVGVAHRVLMPAERLKGRFNDVLQVSGQADMAFPPMVQHVHSVTTMTVHNAGGGASLTQALLAVVAILSVIGTYFGVYIQGRNTTRQIRATVVSANRQKWIDSVRMDTAAVLGAVSMFRNHMQSILPSRETSEAAQEKRLAMEEDARAALFRAMLLLDLRDPLHQDLFGALQSIVRPMRSDYESEAVVAEAIQKIVATEMEKMKRGE